MRSTKRKPLKFAPRPNPREAERKRRQSDFLRFLAQGESIHDACALVGVTRSCYEHWRTRHKDFPAAVAAARESHRRDIACGFHTADAYARVLLDAIQRDEALPAALRYRAAKSILTRKGKADRLPEPLPAPACIALSLLEAKETASTRFHHRTARLRQEHEAALDRLESKLFRHQQRRESAPHPERQNPLQLPITPRPNQAQADKDQNATAASTASSFPGGSR